MKQPAASAKGAFLNASAWLKGMIRAVIRPRPRSRLYEWLDRNVVVPESSGGPNPGRLRTSRFPIFRGLYDLAQQRHVHFLTLCSSARAGKTLFCICLVLYWLCERFGQVVWLDPTRNSARKLVRDELDDFLLECEPVRAIAILSKKTWTTLEKCFRGKRFRIVGSGAEADLHGFNAELAIVNETDRCRASTDSDAASDEKIVARTKLFASTRLICRNSTPGDKGEFSPIWQHFLRGSQHHAYLPCPHCSETAGYGGRAKAPKDPGPMPVGWSPLSREPGLAGWQRLTFFPQKTLVPFSMDLQPILGADGKPAPRELWREEVTGSVNFSQFAKMEERARIDDPTQKELVRVGWDLDGVENGTTYTCAHCAGDIESADLPWMLARYRWAAHNPLAKKSDISAHVWSLYSPFEHWGAIATEFLQAKGSLGLLIKFWNLTLGLPFLREGTAIKEDDLDRVIARTPVRYVQGQLPMEAEQLLITIDKQGTQFWFVIRAYGILWDHPERPTWSALVDWGEAVSWEQLLEKCGHIEDRDGHLRRFSFAAANAETRDYMVTAGLVDCGFEQQTVWDFCLTQSSWLSPSKGGDVRKCGGNTIRLTPVMDEQLDLVWYWSDYYASDLYYNCIKDGATLSGPVFWWLPTNLDADYRKQLTDEYQREENGKRIWDTRTKTNHLGDCEKLQRVLAGSIEDELDAIRAERVVWEGTQSKAA
ncbi:MAG TPA: terminase gpA endonuclease subunit [Chthoniobacteraceae bacterium]|jgi:hypothetical protein